MAKTKADVPTPEEQAAQEWVDTLEATPGAATEAEAQAIERHQAAQDVIEGVVTDLTRAAAARAAEYVDRVKAGPNMTQVIMFIAAKAVDTSELNSVISEQLAARILTAETPDEILDPFSTVKGSDLFDRPITVTGVMYLESDKGEGFPWYVSLDVENEATGGTIPLIVGGEKLVPQVAGFDMRDAWPQRFMIHSETTRKGNTIYSLVKAPRY